MRAAYAILLLIPASFAFPQADSPVAGRAGAPMRLGFGSEGVGLGNAMVATKLCANAGYYNPALVAYQRNPEVFVSVGFLALDRGLNFANFSVPLPPQAGLSIGIINAGVSNIDGRDSDGKHTETLSTSENMFLLSFGIKPVDPIAIGVSAKILYYRLYSEISSTTASFDVGIVYSPVDELAVGAVVQDIGSRYRWDTTQLYGTGGNATVDEFPVRTRAGISVFPGNIPLIAALEGELVAGVLMLKVGAAFSFTDSFSLRAGIDQIGVSHDLASRPSVGFSLRTSTGTWTSHLSYALVLEPYAPHAMHLLTVGLEFR
jgi:hypothetical protein